MRQIVGLAAGVAAGAVVVSKLRRDPLHLHGRVALITGGSRGLGLALARELGQQGCWLALLARGEEQLEEAAAELRRRGISVSTFMCDVADRDALHDVVNEVVQHHGRLDILINNAGVIQVGPAQEMRREDYEEAQRTMFWGPLDATLAALPHFQRQGEGYIVNIASMGGKVAVPHLLPYNAAKFALVGLSEGLHAELARENIHVLTVAPGLLRTGSHLNAQFRGRHAREFSWFGLGATSRILAMSPARAAESIVHALRRRQGELVLSLPAKVLATLHGLAPSTVGQAMALANRTLPRPAEGPTETRTGQEILQDRSTPVTRYIRSAGRPAVEKYQ